MTSSAPQESNHDLAIVRALRAMLEDAVGRSEHDVARALAEQIVDELRRQSTRFSRR